MSNTNHRPTAQEREATSAKKSRSNHTRDLHVWLHQVALDRELPHTAFKVAYIIGEHVNRESGEAWPSTERIAQGCALKQSTVVGLVRKLEAAGHLAIDPGQAGRGHSHHYRTIIKHRGADILPINKTSGRLPENIGRMGGRFLARRGAFLTVSMQPSAFDQTVDFFEKIGARQIPPFNDVAGAWRGWKRKRLVCEA